MSSQSKMVFHVEISVKEGDRVLSPQSIAIMRIFDQGHEIHDRIHQILGGMVGLANQLGLMGFKIIRTESKMDKTQGLEEIHFIGKSVLSESEIKLPSEVNA